ncbi:MAG TPA: T9SS type A sorting domain-containing protein, partial [Dongiaceae bacterium]|nr:T9SS type A sorting domain-containing protein [Dongiaceae bacterium]
AMHRDRPHEIFAEDFRVLFGGELAAGSGRVENPYLSPPASVPELSAFFLSLEESRLPIPAGHIVSLPNPAPAGMRIGLSLSDVASDSGPVEISVFDVEGRRVTGLPVQSGVRTSWNGRLENGSAAPPGLYFLRAIDGANSWTGKLLIAR